MENTTTQRKLIETRNKGESELILGQNNETKKINLYFK